MEHWLALGLSAIGPISFTSPLLFLIAVPFLLALAISMRRARNKKGAKVKFSDTSHLSSIGSKKAKVYARARAFSLVMIILLSATLFTKPELTGKSHVEETATTEHMRTVIVVIDISASMAHRADYASSDKRTHFEVVRDALTDFIESEDNMRVGIIFYSKDPLQYRRPTEDLEALVEDLEALDLVNSVYEGEYTFGSLQLSEISSNTDTVPALYVASKTLEELDMQNNLQSAAIILLSDLKDDMGDISSVLRDLAKADVKTYIIASRSERSVYHIRRTYFEDNNKIRLFSARSEDEIKEAYGAISELESTPIIVRSRVSSKRSISTEIALLLFFFVAVFVFVAEKLMPRTRSS